jgi:cellulose synthase/poly-beta-1,6-N-acetylglucosamine synthase-like glycosyltransferase
MPDYLLCSLLILHGLAACGLFLYGMNCYVLLFLHRRMSTQGLRQEMARPAAWPASPAQYPRVTVQLPVYNERYVIQRLVEAVVRLHYPRTQMEIQLYGSTDDDGLPLVECYNRLWFKRCSIGRTGTATKPGPWPQA